mgnify:CR=1 FL=1
MQSPSWRTNYATIVMKKTPYVLKALSISKMPGFPTGLKKFEGFSNSINIISGPNSSGKSSTARVIQQLIWHEKSLGLKARGSVLLDQENWEIDIDSNFISTQRNGLKDEIRGIPAEGNKRYMLALHELVKTDEADLASEILRQSIGGYDLDKAKDSLNYSTTIRNKASTEFKEYEKSEEKYIKIRDGQRELKKEEKKLEQLFLDKKLAQEASKLRQFYEKVADYLRSKLNYEQLSTTMGEFPDSMENIIGNEVDEINDLENQISETAETIKRTKEDIEARRRQLKTLTIPENGIQNQTITELEERIEKLRELERKNNDLVTVISGLKERTAQALKNIDSSVDPSEWDGLNLDDVSGLDKMLQDALRVLGEKEFLLAEINALQKELEEPKNIDSNPETLRDGIKTLGNWLKEQTGTKGIPNGIVYITAVIGIIAAIATYFIGWPGLLGIILMVALMMYAFTIRKKDGGVSNNIRKHDFEQSGLKAPAQWTIDNVAQRIDELTESLQDARETEKFKQRLTGCKEQLSKLQESLDQLNSQRDEWIEKLKIAPEFLKTNPKDFSSLYWFLKQVKDWQDAHVELISNKAQKNQLEQVFENMLEKTNVLLAQCNFNRVGDASEARAAFLEINKQELARKENVNTIEQREEQIKEKEVQQAKASNRRKTIYARINIGEGDKDKVIKLVNTLAEYKEVYQEYYAAKKIFLDKETHLKDHSLYSENEMEIERLSIDQAQEYLNKNKEDESKLEIINREIAEIETLIQDKKKGHELGNILDEKGKTLDNLEQLYQKNLQSITGSILVDQLKTITRNQNRPAVFSRANEILNKITNGRYELRLEEKENPAFIAYDTILKNGLNLSQISTGTRVQLLLAVRLAFVESQETTVKLPLLADELLANSDDERAKAIIDALIEISRDGRQVFYFTAQADEVGKWQHFLNQAKDIDYQIISLGDEANSSYPQPDAESVTLVHKAPSPNGKSYEEYGKEMSVQPFNILIQSCSELSIWYLISDVNVLYKCLKKDIKQFGQLDSYYRNNGKISGLDEPLWNNISSKIKLLERYLELYRKGRPKFIDREVLINSNAVSDSFIDVVTHKLETLNGNPKKLIQALKRSEISGFRSNKISDLEEYLYTSGYLDDQEIMDNSEIMIQLNAFISNMGMEVEEAENFIQNILQQ